MKLARWTEITTWAVGIVLLSSYAILRVSEDWDRRNGLQAFQALRHTALVQTPAALLGDAADRVDPALWSQARIQAFRRTTLHELPEGVLRVPALDLVVPIYSGTSSSELDRGAERSCRRREPSSDSWPSADSA